MRKSISRKLNKVVSVIIALAMVVTMFSITPAFSKRVSASMDISFSGPSVEAGLSTWNCVYFGSYYQENDTVKLPIKWRILENSDDSLLLLADKNLENIKYNNGKNVSWENSSLRAWLGSTFYNEAFNAEEKADICDTPVNNSSVVSLPNNATKIGDITITEEESTFTDKVFVLSVREVLNPEYGFTDDNGTTEFRASVNTKRIDERSNALSNQYNNVGKTGIWWLRTTIGAAGSGSNAARVDYDGSVKGKNCSQTNACVRPVIRVDKDSDNLYYAGTVSSDGSEMPYSDGLITYYFDNKTNELSVYGTGNMPNYDKGEAPWAELADQIESVNLSDKITSIGAYAFEGCKNLEYIYVPDSVESIDSNAFYNASYGIFVSVSDETTVDKSKINCTSIRSKTWPIEVTNVSAPKNEDGGEYHVTWSAPIVNEQPVTGIQYRVYVDGVLKDTFDAVPNEYTVDFENDTTDHKIRISTIVTGSKNRSIESKGKSVRTSLYNVDGATYDDASGWTTWGRVYFGHYLQDSNGKGWYKNQPIQWRVLGKDGEGYALLLADKNLDCEPFNHAKINGLSWENSDLRKWLNSDFMDAAFTEEEQSMIEYTDTSSNDTYIGKTENINGNDKIFLLTQNDVSNENYGFHHEVGLADSERVAKSTDYNVNYKNIHLISGPGLLQNDYHNWWLRNTRPEYSGYAYRVDYDGNAGQGRDVNAVHIGVRPAIRINLSAAAIYDAGSASASQTEMNEQQEALKYTIRIDGKRVARVDAGQNFTFPTELEGRAKDGYVDYNSDGSQIIKPGTSVAINSNKNFVSIEASVETANARSIRLVPNEAGIQFYSTVRINGNHEIRSSSFEYGTIMSMKDDFDIAYGGQYNDFVIDERIDDGWAVRRDMTQYPIWKDGDAGKEAGEFIGQLRYHKEGFDYDQKFVARGYLVINYTDGTSKTIYSNSSFTPRSVREVAIRIKNNPNEYNSYTAEERAMIDEIISAE